MSYFVRIRKPGIAKESLSEAASKAGAKFCRELSIC